MKSVITILTIITIMTAINSMGQNGKASTVKKTFSRQTSVNIDINADAVIIWALLTNASDFARWNSTIISIEGNIEKGQKIKLKSTLAPKRTFKIKVREIEAEKRMVWGDGKGERVFTLTKNRGGGLTFSMIEKMGGLFFPMYSKYIPPFNESFEQFAADLKKEAELIQHTKN